MVDRLRLASFPALGDHRPSDRVAAICWSLDDEKANDIVTQSGDSKQPLTPQQLVESRRITNVQVSPDGSSVAFILQDASRNVNKETEHGTSAIWVTGFGSGEPQQLTSGLWFDQSPQWSPDGRRLALLSDRAERGKGKEPKASLYLLPVNGGEAVRIWDQQGSMTDPRWSPDGRFVSVLFTDPETEEEKARKEDKDDAFVWDENLKYQRLWVIDVATGAAVAASPEKRQVRSYAWAPDSDRLAICTTPNPRTDDIFLETETAVVARTGGDATLVFRQTGVAEDLVWSADGERLAFRSSGGQVVQGEYVFSVSVTGGGRTCLTEGYGGTGRKLLPVDDGAGLFFYAVEGVNDAAYRLTWTGEREPLFPHGTAGATDTEPSISADGRCLAVAWEGPTQAQDIWTVATPGSLVRRTSFNTALEQAAIGATEIVRWTSDPGVDVEGILITPVGYEEGRRYPLVVQVHGGPTWAWQNRFYASWHDWGQLLAGQGHAVLMPNPRGSTGRGTEYVNAIANDVGGGEFRDMMTGVDYLVERGIADPDRLAIGGWSWGGYMTAWAITQTDRFKAAVMGAGLPNMVSDNGLGDIPSANLSYFNQSPYHDPEPYWERSAIRHVRNVVTPTLILHGEADDRVHPAEGQELYIALRALGVPTQFVTYPREGHGIKERKHQLDLMRRVIGWYERYLS